MLWADEAQRFMPASEDGTSDYNCVDVIREAGATIVAAAQSTTSLIPPLGQDKSKVLTLNLRNRIIFRSAGEVVHFAFGLAIDLNHGERLEAAQDQHLHRVLLRVQKKNQYGQTSWNAR